MNLKKFPATILFLMSCITGIIIAAGTYSFLALALCLLGLFFWSNKNVVDNKKKILFCVLFFILGFTSFHKQQLDFANFENKFGNRKCLLIARVTSINYDESKNFKYSLKLSLESIKIGGWWQPIHQQMITCCALEPKLAVGDKIVLQRIEIKPTTDEHFKQYLIKEKVCAYLFVPKLFFKKLSHAKSISDHANIFIASIKNKIEVNISKKSNSISSNLFRSIFLGEKNAYDEDLDYSNNFNQWGIAHVLARSGLHLAMLLILLRYIMNATFLSISLKRLVSLLFLFFFYATSNPATPFIRSFLMYLLNECCILLKVEANTLHIFCLTTIIMLMLNPILLFFIDFQLSFFITFLLIAWSARS